MWPEQAEPSAGLSPMALQGSPGRAEDRARSWVSGPGLQLQGLGSAAGDQHSDLFGCFEMGVKVIQEKGIMEQGKEQLWLLKRDLSAAAGTLGRAEFVPCLLRPGSVPKVPWLLPAQSCFRLLVQWE